MSASPPVVVEARRSSSAVRSNKRMSMGPRLPVRVMSAESKDAMMSEVVVTVERPLTPGDSSDNNFEDAREAASASSRRPSSTAGNSVNMEGAPEGGRRRFSFEAPASESGNADGQGLGLTAITTSNANANPPAAADDKAPAAPDQDEGPPVMSARLSSFINSDDHLFDVGAMAEDEDPPLPDAPPSTSPSTAVDGENEAARGKEGEHTAGATATASSEEASKPDGQNQHTHSRQNTPETISVPARGPSVGSDGAQDEAESIPAAEKERDSRPSILANVNALRERSQSSEKDGGARHSRSETQDTIPTLLPSASQERSTSPAYFSPGQLSPTKEMPGSFGSPSPSLAVPGQPTSASTTPQPPGLARSASTSFKSFLGRVGSIRKARSPPAPKQEPKFSAMAERRNTGASMVSTDSRQNLATIPDDDVAGDGKKLTLQDQFQKTRKQEERNFPGMTSDTEEEDGDAEKTPVAVRMSSISEAERPMSPTKNKSRASSRPTSMKSPPLNPSLPPGTASGLTAGPSAEPHPVDWDLWQSVVYEGPSAVARTSGEELNRAIASGIPPAIRGVVWQVLAESKSEELENMYHLLKTKGTDSADEQHPGPPSRQESTSTINGTREKNDKESEASSTHSSAVSGDSTPATSAMASPPASEHGEAADLRHKLLAEKQKRERDAIAKLEKVIKRDMGTRTSYSKFTQSPGLQDGLFGVCKAYALFDETVGYAQGMNFIAMPLLFNMSEEESFTLLVRLMNKYDVRSLFVPEMPGLHLRLYQFERLLEDLEPALYCHLRRRNVEPKLYATQWFLTLFAYRFPLQLVLRVYDLIFSEGLTAIMKFGIVLMQHNRDALLAMKDMSQLTTFLKDKLFDVYIDKSPSASSLLDGGFFGSVTGGADKELYRADEMVRDACGIQITDATLAAYTQEWDDIQRKEREHTEALDTLRAANASLTAKVRELENRTQAMDGEHVTLAGDNVKYKLENDTLHDRNEELRHKCEELQKMVDAQPAEVEAKVRGEMESILAKNERVQDENRRLKEELGDMEESLVGAKMQAAQIQTDYDDLQQKWSSLQGLLNGKSGSPPQSR